MKLHSVHSHCRNIAACQCSHTSQKEIMVQWRQCRNICIKALFGANCCSVETVFVRMMKTYRECCILYIIGLSYRSIYICSSKNYNTFRTNVNFGAQPTLEVKISLCKPFILGVYYCLLILRTMNNNNCFISCIW